MNDDDEHDCRDYLVKHEVYIGSDFTSIHYHCSYCGVLIVVSERNESTGGSE